MIIELGEKLFSAVIVGEPCSKSNSPQLNVQEVNAFDIVGGTLTKKKKRKPKYRKSESADLYCEAFELQMNALKVAIGWGAPIQDEVFMVCVIYYTSQRKDLDESLICDMLQKTGIVKNDRLIRTRFTDHFIDKQRPRANIVLHRRL